MDVRAARPDDAEDLRTAVSRAREETVFDDIGAPLLDVSAAGVREAAAEAEWSFLMEHDEEGPVGLAIAHPDPDGTEAELLALWVHPNRAGEGVAAELLARVGSALADRGVKTLRATVPSDRPSAEEFFSAHGFAPRGTRRSPAGDESIVVADPDALT
ncbi:GNAT family N-acetyltransferase [Halorubrum ezzemoulense]|jgi:N-acetylglutamate synthase-like GNAT family acetyltransferase|uniref:N-acetyltransferase n=2 Tax=Halorubrum ezzemoulense TaxID=337243 RepID=A0A256JYR0_HALEZ|nr:MULTISPECIES: GNAT family N-acetyltransferase [Halorubrum]MDB2223597.1 GNAT family N-acetyltransferase [Halorubrum ezzemoulense]MDB2236619.1 GNAT family N-acetyltransferase [Halorubrum ezzemoulense]MDB2241025.1 GNAT family N-acetyltransferase [Halorubrum ezzemoulense]MDB2244723.1 GNAT family N-acetyltransferase [Halorubrum ezzemoulense]MDB2248093.1 GNAT family N-acetyltransferase [Halorubrum ezzemoulense]